MSDALFTPPSSPRQGGSYGTPPSTPPRTPPSSPGQGGSYGISPSTPLGSNENSPMNSPMTSGRGVKRPPCSLPNPTRSEEQGGSFSTVKRIGDGEYRVTCLCSTGKVDFRLNYPEQRTIPRLKYIEMKRKLVSLIANVTDVTPIREIKEVRDSKLYEFSFTFATDFFHPVYHRVKTCHPMDFVRNHLEQTEAVFEAFLKAVVEMNQKFSELGLSVSLDHKPDNFVVLCDPDTGDFIDVMLIDLTALHLPFTMVDAMEDQDKKFSFYYGGKLYARNLLAVRFCLEQKHVKSSRDIIAELPEDNEELCQLAMRTQVFE